MKNEKTKDGGLPIRLTLVDQAVQFLREGIECSRWPEGFPSEMELVRELGIARGTLRSALSVLFEEGLLKPGGRGGRHTVMASKKKRSKEGASSVHGDIVRILSPQPRFIVSGQTQQVFQTVSEVIGRAGFHLEFEHHSGLWRMKNPNSVLKKITAQPSTAAWLLYRSTEAVQKWFESGDIPAVVLGGKHPSVSLSNAEFDLAATSRHAAGLLAARGRKRVVFLMVDNATAGDYASAKAFEESAASLGLQARSVFYDDTVPGLCRALDALLAEEQPPDGFLVAFPNHVPATIGHLNRRNYPVPESAAVLSRMGARLLAQSIPSIARYEGNAERVGKGLGRLLIEAIENQGKGRHRATVVMPEFVDGESAGSSSPK